MEPKVILSRREAIEAGSPVYYTGIPCKRGHYSERRTQAANCIECETAVRRYISKKMREGALARATAEREAKQEQENRRVEAATV